MSRDPVIVNLIKAARDHEGKLCSSAQSLLKHTLEQNQAYRAIIRPDEVGVHPSNRDGGGVEEAHVHALGAKISRLGFLRSECSGAVCVEDSKSVTIAEFTVACLNACPRLAPAQKNTIRYGSLSGSHTNQLLRCAAAAAPCDIPEISENQRMSAAKMCQGDPEFAKAIECGLEWLVLKAETVEKYPELPALIQSSRNAPGSLHREETQIDIMMRMLTLSQQHIGDDQNPNWAAVRSELEKTCSRHAPDFISFQKFIRAWAGGPEAFFLKELQTFWAARVPPGRYLPGAIWCALGELECEASELCPRVVMAFVWKPWRHAQQPSCLEACARCSVYLTSRH